MDILNIYILLHIIAGISMLFFILVGMWVRRESAWEITRYNSCGFECERYNRVTKKYQHRHYTDNDWSWKDGKNPYRDNIKEKGYEFDA